LDFTFIKSNGRLIEYLNKLDDHKTDVLALDVEGDFNLHQYGEKLCLIQLYDGEEAVLIDPFKVSFDLIKRILESRSILKIMFDAPGDRAFLFKNHGIDVLSILDLQTAVLLLNYEKNDLASVLHAALGIEHNRSKKKFQQYNWTKRPIEDAALEYAVDDVVHLFDLKEKLLADIIQNKLMDQFILRNLQAQNKPHIYSTKPRLFRTKNFKTLKSREQRMFETLYQIREKHAKRLNHPPHSILPNDLLFRLAMSREKLSSGHFGKRVPRKAVKEIMQEMKENCQ
jgi:ribonuclease D